MSRLGDIRNRANAVIPGPWRWWGNTATNQVYLGTVDRGRLILLDVHTDFEEYVYDHETCTTYTVEEAKARVLDWCTVHGDPEFPGIRDLLSGVLSQEEGRRDLHRGGHLWLTRQLTAVADLRVASPDGDTGTRNQRGATRLESYAKHVRYEVLGRKLVDRFSEYRTIAEYEAEEGRDHHDALYRQDFCGIATPEAELIQHAPEDIGYLLLRLQAAEAYAGALQELVSWTSLGQALQGTADAERKVMHAHATWEATQ